MGRGEFGKYPVEGGAEARGEGVDEPLGSIRVGCHGSIFFSLFLIMDGGSGTTQCVYVWIVGGLRG